MNFDEDSLFPDIIKRVPHLAFVVNDVESEIRKRGFEVLIEPNEPMEGLKVAMIKLGDAPIELMEFAPS